MRLLVLVGAYHPFYSANGLCVKNIVDECVSRGIDVTCVVNAARGCPSNETIDGARIKRVRPRLITRWQQRMSNRESVRIAIAINAIVRMANRVKMLVMSPAWPLVSPLYTRRFYRAAMELHEKEPFDAVVAAYTPIDTLLAGYKLKKAHPEIVFIPYYLDALAGGWGPSFWPQEKTNSRTRKYETRIDAVADTIVSMGSSRSYHDANPLDGGIQDKRVYLGVPMMKGVYSSESTTIGIKRKKPYVLYAGGIPFPRRSPRPILELLTEACCRLDIEFVIAGECNKPSLFDPYIERSGGRIVYLGWQDKKSVDSLEDGAIALVNIGSENPNTIPCKIFEYMGHLKPIISTYKIDDEPSKPFLTEYGYSYFVDEREEGALKDIDGICEFINSYQFQEIPPEAYEGKFYENSPEALVELIEREVMRGRNA